MTDRLTKIYDVVSGQKERERESKGRGKIKSRY
jgi:hypothetical protein